MIDPADIYPLTDFLRDAKSHIRRLRKSRKPQLLTVNGRAAVVVLDPETYAYLSRLADGPSVVERAPRGTADNNARRVKPADKVLNRVKAKVPQRLLTRRRSE